MTPLVYSSLFMETDLVWCVYAFPSVGSIYLSLSIHLYMFIYIHLRRTFCRGSRAPRTRRTC